MEKLELSVTVPTDIDGHGGNGDRVRNDRDQTGILELIDGVKAFGHIGLRVDDAGVVSIVMQMDVMVAVVFQPAAVKIESDNGCNEDDQGHNVVREIHKRLPFLSDLQVRRAIVRGVTDSFAGMILLFRDEYKGVDNTLSRWRRQRVRRRARLGCIARKPAFSPGRVGSEEHAQNGHVEAARIPDFVSRRERALYASKTAGLRTADGKNSAEDDLLRSN